MVFATSLRSCFAVAFFSSTSRSKSSRTCVCVAMDVFQYRLHLSFCSRGKMCTFIASRGGWWTIARTRARGKWRPRSSVFSFPPRRAVETLQAELRKNFSSRGPRRPEWRGRRTSSGSTCLRAASRSPPTQTPGAPRACLLRVFRPRGPCGARWRASCGALPRVAPPAPVASSPAAAPPRASSLASLDGADASSRRTGTRARRRAGSAAGARRRTGSSARPRRRPRRSPSSRASARRPASTSTPRSPTLGSRWSACTSRAGARCSASSSQRRRAPSPRRRRHRRKNRRKKGSPPQNPPTTRAPRTSSSSRPSPGSCTASGASPGGRRRRAG